MTIHVLARGVETARLAPLDWMRHGRRRLAGAPARRWILVTSLVVGALLGGLMIGHTRTVPHHG
jgi:hypothetical protein